MRDDELAARIRAVAAVLRGRSADGGVDSALALALEGVALMLDPDGTAADTAAIVPERLLLG